MRTTTISLILSFMMALATEGLALSAPSGIDEIFTDRFQPPPPRFFVDANGITIRCPDAEIGESGVVGGKTYTKRSREQVTPENAATTCTSGIINMSGMFAEAWSFNQPLDTWDVSSVTNMSGMFSLKF